MSIYLLTYLSYLSVCICVSVYLHFFFLALVVSLPSLKNPSPEKRVEGEEKSVCKSKQQHRPFSPLQPWVPFSSHRHSPRLDIDLHHHINTTSNTSSMSLHLHCYNCRRHINTTTTTTILPPHYHHLQCHCCFNGHLTSPLVLQLSFSIIIYLLQLHHLSSLLSSFSVKECLYIYSLMLLKNWYDCVPSYRLSFWRCF